LYYVWSWLEDKSRSIKIAEKRGSVNLSWCRVIKRSTKSIRSWGGTSIFKQRIGGIISGSISFRPAEFLYKTSMIYYPFLGNAVYEGYTLVTIKSTRLIVQRTTFLTWTNSAPRLVFDAYVWIQKAVRTSKSCKLKLPILDKSNKCNWIIP